MTLPHQAEGINSGGLPPMHMSYDGITWSPMVYHRAKARSSKTVPDAFGVSGSPSSHSSNKFAATSKSTTASSNDWMRREYPSTDSQNTADSIEWPSWYKDLIDLEAGCSPWPQKKAHRLSWIPTNLFGSKIEEKARNPADCSSIGYDISKKTHLRKYLLRFVTLFIFCWLVYLFHDRLGMQCLNDDAPSRPEEASDSVVSQSPMLEYVKGFITLGACFLMAQGHFGLRTTRERMERVRQTGMTLAYSLLKTTRVAFANGYDSDTLQLVIYECLALTTAYPVALLEQIRGNTCEPAVTTYCKEVAVALACLRRGEEPERKLRFRSKLIDIPSQTKDNRRLQIRHYESVDHFFEIFSLRLSDEFRRQPLKKHTPSLAPQHIVYNLRNHFENLVDRGNLDERRVPIVRENIDMMAMCGRECAIFAIRDVIPIAFMWVVDICFRIYALSVPIKHCNLLVPQTAAGYSGILVPSAFNIFAMICISLISAAMLSILAEMWSMWDPYSRAVNTFAWTLGMAQEIDNMLNDFYEFDTDVMVRAHAYMTVENPESDTDSSTAWDNRISRATV